MPARDPSRLLILGGTAEAAALARAAAAAFGGRVETITALAGRTRDPAALPGRLRSGGFGGALGLAGYLAAERIAVVVDATHPFAETISEHARAACDAAKLPRLVLARQRWRSRRGDRWIEVDDVAGAAQALARRGGRAFITVGAKELGAFAGLDDVFCLVRLIEPPATPLPLADHAVIAGRGPFTIAAEKRLLADHRIDVVVSKASGGAATRAKITAARQLGLPAIMVRRPPDPPGERVGRVPAALGWIADRIFKI